jgi:hypothetical protein
MVVEIIETCLPNGIGRLSLDQFMPNVEVFAGMSRMSFIVSETRVHFEFEECTSYLIKATASSRIRVARWCIYFHTKKSQFGYILEGLGMENVCIFLPFGIFHVILCIPLLFLYTLWSFGTHMFLVWVCRTNKNLATLF